MTIITVGKASVEIGNLAKVLYPATGFTKCDMIAYYHAIAPVMLPHLAQRPVMLKRFPDGVERLSFYEKRCPAKRPPWVHQAIVSSSTHGSLTYCVIDNAATLVWLANRAAIEYHTCLFRDGHEDQPTMLMFDLDPGPPAGFAECLDIAVQVRDLLRDLDLQAFAKTSGGKGLHLGVPVYGASFTQAKTFAHAVAELLAKENPQHVTTRMRKSERRGRVLIDWSQNDHGKTTACVYTLRAQERPMVSAPVTWDEIDKARRTRRSGSLQCESARVLARVAEMGDLFAPTLTLRQLLPREYATSPA